MSEAQENVPVVEDTSAEEQAAFESGFQTASGKDVPNPVQVEPKEEEPEVEPVEPEQEESPAEEPTTEEEEVAGIPVSQLKSMLAKTAEFDNLKAELVTTRDRMFGKIGELQRTLNEVQQRPSQAGVKLAAAQLKRLSAEYPDLAEALAQDLSEVSAPEAQAQPQIDLDSYGQQITSQVQQQFETRLVEMIHPDWRETVKEPDFVIWKQGLPDDLRQGLDTSWDATFISQGLAAYKEWRDGQRVKAQSKKQRLEAAVQPSGVPQRQSAVADEADAFMAGFNSVRGVK